MRKNRCFEFLPATYFSFLFTILIFTHLSNGYAQYNKFGYPITKNYNFKDYQATGANLAATMNSKGVMYFANANKGILEYDGTTWKQIHIKQNSQCKSIAIDSNDVVYVGAVGEMGYILPDNYGNSVYHSITYLIDTTKIHFTNIWKTYATKKGVFYCSLSHIFHFKFPNHIDIIELPSEAFFSFYQNEKLINGFYKSGLLEYDGSKMVNMHGVEKLINQDITQVLPFSKTEWLVFTYNGLFIYNTQTNKTESISQLGYNAKTNTTLSKNTVYNGCTLPQIGFGIATMDNGIFISDTNLNLTDNYNSKTGLQSSTISDIYYNQHQGILWATLDNGISKIEYNSPFRLFGKESNLNGIILSAIRHNGILYVGTFTGLSYQTFDQEGIPWFKEVEELKGKFVYSLINLQIDNGESKLIAGTGDDFYEIKGTKATAFNESGISSFVTILSKIQPNTFFAGGAKGVQKVKWSNGKWSVQSIPNSGKDINSICEDTEGNIWVTTAIDGLLKITTKNQIITYTTSDGLPSNSNLRVYYSKTDNILIIGSQMGFYKLDPAKNRFEPYSAFNLSSNQMPLKINDILDGCSNIIWVNNNNHLIKITPRDKSFFIDSVSSKRLPEMSIESIYSEENGITWICTSEGLFSYNNNFNDTFKKPYYALIRKVNTGDKLIFGGDHSINHIVNGDTIVIITSNQPINVRPTLKYANNDLTFTYASPYFKEESSVQFSYALEGYKKDWSSWSNNSSTTYTNLYEGSYTFKVKAKNIYGQISQESSFSFTILPPWYRTIWSFVGYFILAIAVLIFSVKFYTRKLEADKKRLEGIVAERTAEVVKQKVEIEHKNKEITSSIVYAKRIQEAMLPVKDQISIPNLELFVYFKPKDIVSGDFFFLKQIPETNTLIASAVDCTGHGVPGAFMSMLGLSFLNELASKSDNLHSDEILNNLRLQVIASLNPKGIRYETKDGMDIALIVYNYKSNRLEFSGANNPLYHIRNGELNEIKADKMPIGLHERCGELFRCEEIIPQPGDIVYMFSDGFEDQFGGDKGKKYMSKNFKEFLLSIHMLPMEDQERLIAEESIRWRGEIEQIDDQVVMGIRFL